MTQALIALGAAIIGVLLGGAVQAVLAERAAKTDARVAAGLIYGDLR